MKTIPEIAADDILPIWTFKSDDDVRHYLSWMIDNGLTYHFDDDLTDVFDYLPLNNGHVMEINNLRLWHYCNPWDFFDKPENSGYWEAWTKNG